MMCKCLLLNVMFGDNACRELCGEINTNANVKNLNDVFKPFHETMMIPYQYLED